MNQHNTNNIDTEKPPTSLRKAQEELEAHMWKLAYKIEKAKHETFLLFNYRCINKSAVLEGTLVAKTMVTFTYNYNKDGQIFDRKARFSYPGNRLVPVLKLDLE